MEAHLRDLHGRSSISEGSEKETLVLATADQRCPWCPSEEGSKGLSGSHMQCVLYNCAHVNHGQKCLLVLSQTVVLWIIDMKVSQGWLWWGNGQWGWPPRMAL